MTELKGCRRTDPRGTPCREGKNHELDSLHLDHPRGVSTWAVAGDAKALVGVSGLVCGQRLQHCDLHPHRHAADLLPVRRLFHRQLRVAQLMVHQIPGCLAR